jgi:hypothetical protein
MYYIDKIIEVIKLLFTTIKIRKVKISIASIDMVFNTINSDKKDGTLLNIVLKRANDMVIAERRRISGYWAVHSSNSVALPVMGTHYKNEIGGSVLRFTISPYGNEKWEFDYTLIIKWSDGSMTQKEFTYNVLTRNNPDLTVAIL